MSEPAKKPGRQPDSYSPKAKPEILRLAEAAGKSVDAAPQPAIKAAAPAIRAKARNAVRIIELPACKMVWSGVCPNEECEQMRRFEQWWNAQDELRRDRFYTRDFMWWDTQAKGVAWGLAVTEAPADTGGWGVMDFPGGLYAVANFAGGAAEPAYKSIKKWVEKSGCFAMAEEGAGRYVLWHGLCPKAALAAMGYMQYDIYVPIRIKGDGYSPKAKPDILKAAKKIYDKATGRKPAMVIEPAIIRKRFRLVGFEIRIDLREDFSPQMDGIIHRLGISLDSIENKVLPFRPIGFWTGDPDVDYDDPANHTKRMYFFGVEVTGFGDVPPGCAVQDLPESQFAVFREREHGAAPKWEWLKASGYSFNDWDIPGDFEIYDDFEHIDGPSWDILVPIRKGR